MPTPPQKQEPPWFLMILLSVGGTVAAGLILDYLRERRGRKAMLCPTGQEASSPDV